MYIILNMKTTTCVVQVQSERSKNYTNEKQTSDSENSHSQAEMQDFDVVRQKSSNFSIVVIEPQNVLKDASKIHTSKYVRQSSNTKHSKSMYLCFKANLELSAHSRYSDTKKHNFTLSSDVGARPLEVQKGNKSTDGLAKNVRTYLPL